MRTVKILKQFKKDFEKFKKKLSFDDLNTLFEIINELKNDNVIHEKFQDHELKGDFKGFRDCHIKPDLLLIYKKKDDELILVRLNSHSELFK